MEHRFSAKLDNAIGEVKEELCVEKASRQRLEGRVAQLEQQHVREQAASTAQLFEDEDADKSIVVVGGFGDRPWTALSGSWKGVSLVADRAMDKLCFDMVRTDAEIQRMMGLVQTTDGMILCLNWKHSITISFSAPKPGMRKGENIA